MKKYIFILTAVMAVALCLAGACAEREQLSAPQNLHMEGRTLVWDSVEHATGYAIYYDKTEHEISECSYDFSFWTEPDTYEIELLAFSDDARYTDSVVVSFSYTAEEIIGHGYDASGLEYTLLDDGTGYEVSRGNVDLNGVVTLPDFFRGLPVKRIAKEAFMFYHLGTSHSQSADPWSKKLCNKTTTAVRLPSRLESIGWHAFAYMVELKEVTIPDSVTEIESYAFYGCAELKHVKLPDHLKVIPDFCFADCSLSELVFPDSLEEIGAGAFKSIEPIESIYSRITSTFTEIVIPDGVKKIGRAAFSYCINLENITFSKALEEVERAAFEKTAWYERQPDGFVMINRALYKYKGEITSVEIPSDIQEVFEDAFCDQTNLTEVYIPDGVKLIGDGIFAGCTALTSVRLPSDLKVIPSGTFAFCKSLKEIELPVGVTEIEGTAFADCESLEKVVLPAGLKVIGFRAFFKCDALKEIVIPKSVETINESFNLCANLRSIYYEGTCEEWAALMAHYAPGLIGEPFGDANIYCYSQTQPDFDLGDGLYWRYVDGKPVVWTEEN